MYLDGLQPVCLPEVVFYWMSYLHVLYELYIFTNLRITSVADPEDFCPDPDPDPTIQMG
jgi:hypothetical protein